MRSSTSTPNGRPAIVCLGGATVDRTYRARAPLAAGTSNPVSAAVSGFGGVARNVAENLARLGVSTGLVSIVGDDGAGSALASDLAGRGVASRLTAATGGRTAEYLAVLQPSGALAFGLADMDVLDAMTPELIDEAWPLLSEAAWVFADCNLPMEALAYLIERRRERRAFQVAVDAVSIPKARRLPEDLAGVDLLFANRDEACALVDADPIAGSPEELVRSVLSRRAGGMVMTLGQGGGLAADPDGSMTMLPAVTADVVDVTGAGDALIAGTLSRVIEGVPLREALRTGLVAAALAIESRGSVRPDLSRGLLQDAMRRIEAPRDSEDAQ